ncbi:fas apoptotic inhibitory molecule 1-like [Daphnia carinata]|uniref:fas apoptotic inhibitory molecule 1-like n=1 Tax=Daphnia carinata TaxID=120202 RepID=UPI002580CB43|nr:fas apoptotic inhibitory molecule 1-like [Daphnia carinata]
MMPPLERRSIVASWKIIIPEGEFLVEFEHGTTSGKRVLWINGNEYLRKEWMFRLVGSENFRIGRYECKLDVEPDGTFGLLYLLSINGQDIGEFQEVNKKRWITWNVNSSEGKSDTILFEKDTMDVWFNGNKIDCEVQFIDGGNQTQFSINGTVGAIRSISSGNKKVGMIHQFILGDEILQPDTDSK